VAFFLFALVLFLAGNRKQCAMNNNENNNQKIAVGKVAVWNIKVAVFEPAMILSRLMPAESKYWKLKVVLN
jgi:hypothetical protein